MRDSPRKPKETDKLQNDNNLSLAEMTKNKFRYGKKSREVHKQSKKYEEKNGKKNFANWPKIRVRYSEPFHYYTKHKKYAKEKINFPSRTWLKS